MTIFIYKLTFCTEIMINIDKKDLRLLYELDKNCKQTLKQLANKLRSKKNSVLYRINRLERLGIIENYYALIDTFKLGYNSYRLYLKLKNHDPEIEKKIIKTFMKKKEIYFISDRDGAYDLVLCYWVNSQKNFFDFFESIFTEFKPHIKKYVNMPMKSILFPSSYLINDYKRTPWIIEPCKKENVDDLDLNILTQISNNAKTSLVDLAKKNKTNINTIKYRINKLKKLEIIKAYRANINFSKLGYTWFKLDIVLNDYKKRGEVLNYIIVNPNTFVIDESIGFGDIEVELHYKSKQELNDFIGKLMLKFSGVINSIDHFSVDKVYKIDFMV